MKYKLFNPCSNGILKYPVITSPNPCSNGILKYYMQSYCRTGTVCLNPCSNGILKYGEKIYQGSASVES